MGGNRVHNEAIVKDEEEQEEEKQEEEGQQSVAGNRAAPQWWQCWNVFWSSEGYALRRQPLQFVDKAHETAFLAWRAQQLESERPRGKAHPAVRAVCVLLLALHYCFVILLTLEVLLGAKVGLVGVLVPHQYGLVVFFSFFVLLSRMAGMDQVIFGAILYPLPALYLVVIASSIAAPIRNGPDALTGESFLAEIGGDMSVYVAVERESILFLSSSQLLLLMSLFAKRPSFQETVRTAILHFLLMVISVLVLIGSGSAHPSSTYSIMSALGMLAATITAMVFLMFDREVGVRRRFVLLQQLGTGAVPDGASEPQIAPAAAGRASGLMVSRGSVFVPDEPGLNDVLAMVKNVKEEEVEMVSVIGQGAFGSVYRARYQGDYVAVKLFDLNREDTCEPLEFFKRELYILALLRHPNIVCLYGASLKIRAGSAGFIVEYAQSGTFQEILQNYDYAWDNAREKIIAGICKGMSYLHHFLERPVVHHDLKPTNVLVTAELEAKIADFGVSVIASRCAAGSTVALQCEAETRGSPIWLPPEVHRREAYDEKVDVFAFALVLCEALVGDGMYVIKSFKTAGKPLCELYSTCESFRPPIPASVRAAKPGYVSLIERCWAELPDDRPSFAEICETVVDLREGMALDDEATLIGPDATISFQSVQEESLDGAADIKQGDSNGERGSDLYASVRKHHRPSISQDTIGKGSPPMSPSMSGRAFGTFSASVGPNDGAVLRQLCQELQQELKAQMDVYEGKLSEQKEAYEKKLAQLASVVL